LNGCFPIRQIWRFIRGEEERWARTFVRWPWDEEYQNQIHRQRLPKSRSSGYGGKPMPWAPCRG
jgi:hypothetical protein